MNKKVLKYILILLVIPLVVSIIVALYQASGGMAPKNDFDSINGVNYEDINYSKQEQIKRSNPFIYLSVGTLLAISAGTWIYIKKKGEI